MGRFELIAHLASGGMGQVYLARGTGIGGFERRVVIKTLEAMDDDDAAIAMFLDEARVVGQLHHQFIAPVFEVGFDQGRYFFVMDYIPGETAEAIWSMCVSHVQPVPMTIALAIGSAIGTALAYAHSATAADGAPLEIVHRDVSLSNVLVGHDGSIKLLDFGIAKAVNRTSRTQVGALKGKIGYLAPEQVRHKPVDRRTDVFALGIVMYELTTATRAFQESSDLLTFERIIRSDVPLPSHVVPSYPAALEQIVMRALAVSPDDRYQDAGAFAHAIEAFASRYSIPIGHTQVARAMRDLFFDPSSARRRFARSTSSIHHDTDVNLRMSPDLEPTPIPTPHDGDEPTNPLTTS